MTTTQPDLDVELDDSGAGLTMFVIFAAAVLLVTGAQTGPSAPARPVAL